jgi:hypothetical protein
MGNLGFSTSQTVEFPKSDPTLLGQSMVIGSSEGNSLFLWFMDPIQSHHGMIACGKHMVNL